MYPFLAMPPEITPAGALKFVRDHGPVTFAKIQEEFGIGHSTDSRTQLRRGKLDAVLRQLVEAELLRPCHDQPVRARLRESDEFEVTPLAGQIQNSLGLSLSELARLQSRSDLPSVIWSLDSAEHISTSMADAPYKRDLVASLRELGGCIRHELPIAMLSLCGKLLELALKHHLLREGKSFDDSWMLGTLLRRCEDIEAFYIDPGLKNVANIINQSRIPAVHAKQDVPVPSMDQAMMAVHATMDVITRLVLAPSPT